MLTVRELLDALDGAGIIFEDEDLTAATLVDMGFTLDTPIISAERTFPIATDAGPRMAILLEPDGTEVFRGHPADMPFRFVRFNGKVIDSTMNDIVESGIPIEAGDENDDEPEDDEEWPEGEDLELHDNG